MRRIATGLALAGGVPGVAQAHATDQAFVLLLPTGVYSAAGVAVVAVTFLMVALLPDRIATRWQDTRVFGVPPGSTVASLFCTAALFALLLAGATGSRDPLANPLPLVFWTVFWVAFVALTGAIGNLWPWLNPWTGLCRVLRALGLRPVAQLRPGAAESVALASLFAFAAFLLADPAPADPGRLAFLGALYWGGTLVAALISGQVWLDRAELFGALLRWFGALSPLNWTRGRAGLPGWQAVTASGTAAGLVLPLMMLGAGSFDGLNETFLWLGWLGINPLEFPGRSAVILPNLIGLAMAIAALFALFFLAAALGQVLAGPVPGAALRLAPTVLPIALAYHVAHYLPSFLVDIQYVAGAAARAVGAHPPVVTTGFFFDPVPVRAIWLTQGSVVVAGHAFAVLLAHLVALDVYRSRRRAMLSQLPMAAFMIGYTFFGLWLLAAPRGA